MRQFESRVLLEDSLEAARIRQVIDRVTTRRRRSSYTKPIGKDLDGAVDVTGLHRPDDAAQHISLARLATASRLVAARTRLSA